MRVHVADSTPSKRLSQAQSSPSSPRSLNPPPPSTSPKTVDPLPLSSHTTRQTTTRQTRPQDHRPGQDRLGPDRPAASAQTRGSVVGQPGPVHRFGWVARVARAAAPTGPGGGGRRAGGLDGSRQGRAAWQGSSSLQPSTHPASLLVSAGAGQPASAASQVIRTPIIRRGTF